MKKLYFGLFFFSISFSFYFDAEKFFEEKHFDRDFYFFIKDTLKKSTSEKATSLDHFTHSMIHEESQQVLKKIYEFWRWENVKPATFLLDFKKKDNDISIDSISFYEDNLQINFFQNEIRKDKFFFLEKNIKSFLRKIKPFILDHDKNNTSSLTVFLPEIQVLNRKISSCSRCNKIDYCGCVNREDASDFRIYYSKILLNAYFTNKDKEKLQDIESEIKKEFNLNVKFSLR
jgi:hypothetical protein